MNAKDKMQKARIALLLDEPFFGSLLLGLQSIEDRTGQHTKTMATDGVSLYWHTAQVEKWSEAEVKTVLAHETLHCAMLHPLRRQDREPKNWNIACDHAVNLILETANSEAYAKGRPAPFPWPKDIRPVMDKRFTGQSAEDIYGQLQVNQQDQPGSGKGNEPGMGDVIDSPAQDQAEQDQLEAQWKVNTVQAAQAAKARGSVPAGMAQVVDELLNPKVSWRELLSRFIRDKANDDYSWKQPNRRYISTGFILPSLHSQRLGSIAIIRDTSGSTQDWQADILAELAGIISECRPAKVYVLDADAEVQRLLELEPSDQLPTDAVGGGGTDFRPALSKVEELDVACAIYLTDLEGSFPCIAPTFPVLWATNSDSVAPFGDTVKV